MNGKQIPATVMSVRDATHVTLDMFDVGGMGGSIEPAERGDGPEQWQPKPEKGRQV